MTPFKTFFFNLKVSGITFVTGNKNIRFFSNEEFNQLVSPPLQRRYCYCQ